MIKYVVLFDLDGTLVDSAADLTSAVNHVRSHAGLPPLSVADVRQRVGKGARDLMQRVLPGYDDPYIDGALSRYLEFNTLHISDQSTPYPGIVSTLEQLAAQGVTMAVISNKNAELSQLLLQSLGIAHLFTRVCGGDTFSERKPSPLPLLQMMDELGVTPDNCLMVGDSINDIQAGQRAGITTIGCKWGYGTEEELAESDHQICHPDHLMTYIASRWFT